MRRAELGASQKLHFNTQILTGGGGGGSDMTSKERKKREEVWEEGQDLTDSKSKNLGEKLKALHFTINKKVLQLLDYDSISSLWYLSSVHSSIQ